MIRNAPAEIRFLAPLPGLQIPIGAKGDGQ
jgi:hypothetical protein